MGSCFSTGNPAGAAHAPPTAKVITLSGAHREHPATASAASDALAGAGDCFLCSSDKLYCGDYVLAMDPGEPLHPGQIYSVLPAAKLRLPLSSEDMAVRAGAALAASAETGGRRNRYRIAPAPEVEGEGDGAGGVVDGEGLRGFDGKVAGPAAAQRKMRRSGSVRGRIAYRYRSFRVRLTTIPEVLE